MELGAKMEHSSKDIIHENTFNKKCNVEIVHQSDSVEKIYMSDNINDNINNKEKQSLNINLVSAKDSFKDGEPWEIESDSDDSFECNFNLSKSPTIDTENNQYVGEVDKMILVANRKLKNSNSAIFEPLSTKKEIRELEQTEDSNLPAAKKIKPLRFTDYLEMHMNSELSKINLENDRKLGPKSESKKINEHGHNNEHNKSNVQSLSYTDLIDLN